MTTTHQEPPALTGKWAILFGCAVPAPVRGKRLQPVPHHQFGMSALKGTLEERVAIRARRTGYILDYLRRHGPLRSDDLAEVFGLSREVIGTDLQTLSDRKLVTCARQRATSIWRAA